MMTRTCPELSLLLGRMSSTLAPAERLVLEQHLNECADCRRTQARSRSIVELVSASPSPLREAGRERALAAALSRNDPRKVAPRPTRRMRSIGAAVAAAAVLALGLRLAWPGAGETPLAARTRGEQTPPTLAASSATKPTTAPVPEREQNDWIEAPTAQQHAFAHAQVALAAGTRVRFDRATRTLELARGRVDVDVETAPGETFVVSTQLFRVQVLGTQFAVTPERVEVRRGHVQVFEPSGKSLLSELVAGQSFDARDVVASRNVSSADRTSAPRQSTSTLLSLARAAVARGDVASARELVRRVQKRAHGRGEQAEALTLSAECALLEREPEQAARAYLAVANRFRELPAGENALFAAAQLRARAADASATELLQRYLTRYPQGRFADEAKARLRKLEH